MIKYSLLQGTSAALLADICRDLNPAVDFEEHYEELIDGLLQAFNDSDADVLHGAWGALNAILTNRINNATPK